MSAILPFDLARWEELMRSSFCFQEVWVVRPNPTEDSEQILGPAHEMGCRATMASWYWQEAELWCEVRNALPEILELLREKVPA